MVTGNLLIVIFLLSLAALFFAILKLKIEPFLALVSVALVTALVIGMPLNEVASTVTTGFGNTLTGVGILIGLGVIFGQFLGASGAVEKIAQSVLKVFGVKRSPAGLALTGTAVSIPVFFDAAFVILSGLIRSLSSKTGITVVSFVTALGVGLIVSHNMIAPTPGPLVVAENTGAELGLFILYGIIVAIPATLVGGYLYGMLIGKRMKHSGDMEEIAVDPADQPKKEIGTGLSFFMLALPIVLILANTVSKLLLPDTSISSFFGFVGEKNVALLISVFAALFLLRPYISIPYSRLYSEAINSAGIIILITGAGGAFGAVINKSGIGDYLIQTMQSWSIPVLLLAFIFSQILRASLGSATVALVTTSSILGPMAVDLGVSPILLGLAICAGGIGLSLPNDSGFWVVSRFGKLTVPQTLQAWTLGGFIAGLTALATVFVLSLFSGILPGL
ncbi:GntP family permease [Paenibacillus sp. F411]|uniref:Gluconate:H+ symporter family transporter GntP n=1 Tax=Paenibacillus algicola TaxID=2565926 RepID=A0A4P8XPK5_9BACL|nr:MULTISPECIES: gluconate:H+ symporter [Paenibacillus]MBO2944576.1 GntP family permease [Paenibacillus sp. F411]QCT04796.1 gluconate:H+ symporter family transporter GntP [Paenibacillus algicola]